MSDTGPAAVDLEDRYALERGRVFLTGTQALVRLPMAQRRRDGRAGLNTSAFVSGYRGSPLGGVDQQLWRAQRFLDAHHITFRPGVNEDMALTAVWGSQQVNLYPGARYDGTFAMWYAKGPGVDRSGDVMKHGNLAGTSRHGGVLLLAGDDHTCKSSTTAHQSEFAFIDASIPVLSPAGVQEILDLGLHGWAMSRFSGCWTGLKMVADTVDSSASVDVDPDRAPVTLPHDFGMPAGGLGIRWPDAPLEQELRLRRHKLPAVLAYARANGLDRTVVDSPRRRFGIVTTGKAYPDLRQALAELGIDAALAAEIGLAVYKVAMPWPLEPEGLRRFAEGLEEILVVEEKRAVIESQVKEQLYNWRADMRPRVIGEYDDSGAWHLPSAGELTPARIARAVAARIARFHSGPRIRERLARLEAMEAASGADAALLERTPYFCSGCPHNTSTRVPAGSRALAGIGCHYMVLWMDRDTGTFTQMGGEGVSWVGQAPFTDERHVFVNIGDGTYAHSGLMAIRQAVAAGVNITYKLLFNDAVAMTGGQPVEGNPGVPQITRQLHAEGVGRIAVVSDEPGRYPARGDFAPGTTIHHRDDLDAVQRDLRGHQGVSALVYDQTCAAEKRRRRRRGVLADPARRVVINEAVCEGCGDCSVQSNCLAVTPAETEFGRKRRIDQSGCNKDFSCLKGFCPSFVTVEGGRLRRPATADAGGAAGRFADIALPEPELPAADATWSILIAGIGGTGVVTVGALLGMAAHLEGRGVTVLDMAGLAQKGGAVLSHLRIAARPEDIHAVRIPAGGADAVLGCDAVVAAGTDVRARMRSGATRAVVNSHRTATAGFTREPDLDFPQAAMERQIAAATGDRAEFVDATRLAEQLLGDGITGNLLLVGYAWQRGLIPLRRESIERAVELNGVAVDLNRRAFLWGRRAAHAPQRVADLVAPAVVPEAGGGTLDGLVRHRMDFLAGYQDEAYARRYRDLVERVRQAEAGRVPGRDDLARAAAHGHFRLLAAKDEYEVARLHTAPEFLARLREEFEGDTRLVFHMAPPFVARRDPATGVPRKMALGPWALTTFRILAALRRLRGTRLDPFRRLPERRAERELVRSYEAMIDELLAGLRPDNHAVAVELAGLPEHIRGYGHVKERHIAAAREREAELMAAFRAPAAAPQAAE